MSKKSKLKMIALVIIGIAIGNFFWTFLVYNSYDALFEAGYSRYIDYETYSYKYPENLLRDFKFTLDLIWEFKKEDTLFGVVLGVVLILAGIILYLLGRNRELSAELAGMTINSKSK